jgi:hypothetical protein
MNQIQINGQLLSHRSRRLPRLMGAGCMLLIAALGTLGVSAQIVTGPLQVWYPVTITFDGPAASETAATFRNNRMNVTFTKGVKSFTVPGYFAADGNAAETSATSGNKWRVKFTPDEAGLWSYSVSFRTGTDIAASATAGTAGSLDGVGGSFTIAAADPGAPGFYAKGMLKYVGEHFLQFAGSGEWFVKGGPGSPEDIFGYEDFDGTFDAGGSQNDASLGPDGLHAYAAHTNHWQVGDPTWQGGKGKGIIGAINYLASIGMNTLYNVILTHNGDADTTWPWTTNNVKDIYDVSKLDQWDIVFTHMDAKGINSDLYLGESENTKYLNNGDLGVERKIFYRELMARFGYHLGWRWCIGEEPQGLSTAQVKAIVTHLQQLDPYGRAVGAHCSGMKDKRDPFYTPLLGYPDFNAGISQINEDYHVEVLKWITESAAAGTKWVVPLDEPNYIAPTDAAKVREGFWKVVTAGGEGFSLYVAYNDPAYSDVTVEDFAPMSAGLAPLRHGIRFFQLPEVNSLLPRMVTRDNLVSSGYCFTEEGVIYVIYSKTPAGMTLNLSSVSGNFVVKWFDPRNGGALQNGTVANVNGGGVRSLGNPPSATGSEWVALVRKPELLTVNAGPDQSLQFPANTNAVNVVLSGSVSAGGLAVTSAWSQVSGPGTVTFANSNAPVTTATIVGNPGTYMLQLMTVAGTNSASDTITFQVAAYTPDVTPPVVTIVSPVNGTVFGAGQSVAVNATITDNLAGPFGELYVDGLFQGADVQSPFQWIVNGLATGPHTLAVRGVDAAGNAATNSVAISVSAAAMFAMTDGVLSGSNWKPATNPNPPSASAILNFSSATNLAVVWDDSAGQNAKLTYTITRATTAGPGGAQLYYFSGIKFDPSASGPMQNLNLAVDLAKNGNINIASVRFALRQGTNLFYPVAFMNGWEGTLGLVGLDEPDQTTNGVIHTIGTTWTAQYPGTQPNFSGGSPIEFGLFFDGGLGAAATSGSRGPVLDNFRVEVTYVQPSLEATAGAGGIWLNWTPPEWQLQEAISLSLAVWNEVAGAASPQFVATTNSQQYFRIIPPPSP